MIQLDKLITTKQLAEAWGCSTQHINRLRIAGEITAFEIGSGTFRYPPEEIENYLKRHKTKGKAA